MLMPPSESLRSASDIREGIAKSALLRASQSPLEYKAQGEQDETVICRR